MISFDEAVAIVRSAARPLAAERISLQDASGRVLARDVIAGIDSPRADVSAMDGYAMRDDDAVLGATLRIVGQSLPGVGWLGMVGSGTCVRVFTGAPIPDGAERVVIQEHVSRDGETARITSDPGPARWRRGRGGDFKQGDVVVPLGRLLDPTALIAAAGADVAEVQAYRRPQIALISTGDELVEPGQARDAPLAVPDSVAIGLAALAGQWGGEIVSRARLRDDLDSMIAAAHAAVENADVVVVSGGASVGERDFAKAMFEPLGIELSFSKVSIRPGKPAWLGRVSETQILGLPGNPTSALVTARLFLAPMLARVQGRADEDAFDWEPARLTLPLPPCDARETFHRAVLRGGKATPADFQESHAQRALGQSNALIRQAANSAGIPAGETVQVLRF